MSAYLFLKTKRETAARIGRVLDMNLSHADPHDINSRIRAWSEELI